MRSRYSKTAGKAAAAKNKAIAVADCFYGLTNRFVINHLCTADNGIGYIAADIFF